MPTGDDPHCPALQVAGLHHHVAVPEDEQRALIADRKCFIDCDHSGNNPCCIPVNLTVDDAGGADDQDAVKARHCRTIQVEGGPGSPDSDGRSFRRWDNSQLTGTLQAVGTAIEVDRIGDDGGNAAGIHYNHAVEDDDATGQPTVQHRTPGIRLNTRGHNTIGDVDGGIARCHSQRGQRCDATHLGVEVHIAGTCVDREAVRTV